MSNKISRIVITAVEFILLADIVIILHAAFPTKQFLALLFVIAITVSAIALNDVRCNLYKEDEEDDKERIERERLNVKK